MYSDVEKLYLYRVYKHTAKNVFLKTTIFKGMLLKVCNVSLSCDALKPDIFYSTILLYFYLFIYHIGLYHFIALTVE